MPPNNLLLGSLLFVSAYALADDMLTEDAYLGDIPIVLTASRLAQAPQNTPLPLTIITRETIKASGASEVTELFRLVPGFITGHYRGHTPLVNHLFMNDTLSRRLQVMVDGRSIYAPSIGGPIWQTLPLNIDDIERIEVVRGPNGATYGTNAFLGVINIITRDPLLDKGAYFSSRLGNESWRESSLRYHYAGHGLALRFSTWIQSDDGFEKEIDGKKSDFFDLHTDYHFGKNNLRFFTGAGKSRNKQDEPQDPFTFAHNRRMASNYQMLKWERTVSDLMSFYVKLYHNYDGQIEHLTLQNVPLPTSAGVMVQDIPYDQDFDSHRYDAEMQFNQSPTQHLKLAYGASSRQDIVGSTRFLGDHSPVVIRAHRAFVHAAWEINQPWLMNAGLMAEDNDSGGRSLSPLMALHYHINSHHSVRLSATRATRSPVAFEEFPDARIVVNIPQTEDTVVDQLFFDNGDLKAETITTWDFGFMRHGFKHGINVNVNVAHHRMDRLISIVTAPFNDSFGDATTFNGTSDATFITGQLSMQYAFRHGPDLKIGYAYTDATATRHLRSDEKINNAKPWHNGFALVSQNLGADVHANLALYYRDKTRGLDSATLIPATHRLDINIMKNFDADGVKGEFGFAGQNVSGSYDGLYVFNKHTPRWAFVIKCGFN